jgi:hypothetical protein
MVVRIFDTYSSHAPEELVPGITYDTLDMRVYTRINETTSMVNGNIVAIYDVVGYKIFENMVDDTVYLRIADAFTSPLTADLTRTDTSIRVADVTKLPTPSISTNTPGIVFIGSERITYWTINNLTNTLGQIRRGTHGTAIPAVHLSGKLVIDGSQRQLVPGSEHSNITLTTTNTYTVTNTISYNLRLSGNVSANVGDIITQSISGTNVTVIGANLITSSLLVTYNLGNFNYSPVTVELSKNLQANVGNYITQTSSGANLEIVSTNAGGTNVLARYTTVTQLMTGFGNLKLNDNNIGVYPTSVRVTPLPTSNLAINGVYSGVYPYAREQAGSVDIVTAGGNVTIGTGNVLTTARSWYTAGTSTATDGLGFEGDNTAPIVFLKGAYYATETVVLETAPDTAFTTEAVNSIISTENDNPIIREP